MSNHDYGYVWYVWGDYIQDPHSFWYMKLQSIIFLILFILILDTGKLIKFELNNPDWISRLRGRPWMFKTLKTKLRDLGYLCRSFDILIPHVKFYKQVGLFSVSKLWSSYLKGKFLTQSLLQLSMLPIQKEIKFGTNLINAKIIIRK